MGSHIALINLPTCPFPIEALCPERDLALAASYCQLAGRDCLVSDYATVETYERLFPVEPRNPFGFQLNRGMGIPETLLPEPDPGQNYLRQTGPNVLLGTFYDEIVDVLFVEHSPAAVVVKPVAPVDWGGVRLFYERIARQTPRPKILLYTPGGLSACGASSHHAASGFEVDSHFGSLRALLVDGLDLPAFFDKPLLPAYEPETYPVLYGKGKVKVFEVSDEMEPLCEGLGEYGRAGLAGSAQSLVHEIEYLNERYKASAFHVVSASRCSGKPDSLAFKLLSRGLPILYSRSMGVDCLTPGTAQIHRASGCRAVSFQLDTGSQRLLDDFYAHTFSVSQIERLFRECRFSNLFTVAGFTYPCIEDDHHTRAETLRLVARAKPHGVSLRPAPGVAPPRAAFEGQSLARDIEELGVPSEVTARLALFAQLGGFEEHPEEFFEEVHYLYLTGDAEGIASVVERINEGIRRIGTLWSEAAPAQLQNVVGN